MRSSSNSSETAALTVLPHLKWGFVTAIERAFGQGHWQQKLGETGLLIRKALSAELLERILGLEGGIYVLAVRRGTSKGL